jgi:hypothetical protein
MLPSIRGRTCTKQDDGTINTESTTLGMFTIIVYLNIEPLILLYLRGFHASLLYWLSAIELELTALEYTLIWGVVKD